MSVACPQLVEWLKTEKANSKDSFPIARIYKLLSFAIREFKIVGNIDVDALALLSRVCDLFVADLTSTSWDYCISRSDGGYRNNKGITMCLPLHRVMCLKRWRAGKNLIFLVDAYSFAIKYKKMRRALV